MRHRLLHLSIALGLSGAAISTATAADFYGAEPQAPMSASALVPACNDPKVLAEFEDQFEYGAIHMLETGYVIREFSDLTEKAYFPKTEERPIERRYCQGEALISDGERRRVYYTVSHPLGFASLGWKAEGCVLGLDIWHIYGANCQSLRRF